MSKNPHRYDVSPQHAMKPGPITVVACLHTIDSKPAHFVNGFIRVPSSAVALRTCCDCKTILKERKASIANAPGWPTTHYGHVKVKVTL